VSFQAVREANMSRSGLYSPRLADANTVKQPFCVSCVRNARCVRLCGHAHWCGFAGWNCGGNSRVRSGSISWNVIDCVTSDVLSCCCGGPMTVLLSAGREFLLALLGFALGDLPQG
jgi:hypothetical protein